MKEVLHILILSDGKPGHVNQSQGLAEAIGRIHPVQVSLTSLQGSHSLLTRLKTAWREAGSVPSPQLILGAGHAVHTSLIALSRRFGVPAVVMMKPTLPVSLFNLCLIPKHDLAGRKEHPKVIPTLGALNRVPPPDGRERSGGIILLGGPSGSHGWDAGIIHASVQKIVTTCGNQQWEITDSRRSPDGTLDAIAKTCPALHLHPHGDTGRDWLPDRLSRTAEVWVTEDSVSMIYEALSSGSKVGLLPVPALKKSGRVSRGIDELVDQGFATRFRDWSPDPGLVAPPHVLREADRCAAIVLEKLNLP